MIQVSQAEELVDDPRPFQQRVHLGVASRWFDQAPIIALLERRPKECCASLRCSLPLWLWPAIFSGSGDDLRRVGHLLEEVDAAAHCPVLRPTVLPDIGHQLLSNLLRVDLVDDASRVERFLMGLPGLDRGLIGLHNGCTGGLLLLDVGLARWWCCRLSGLAIVFFFHRPAQAVAAAPAASAGWL